MDLKVQHEETDVIITNHVVHFARQTQKTIHVICDDMDVFVLLVPFLHLKVSVAKFSLFQNIPRGMP